MSYRWQAIGWSGGQPGADRDLGRQDEDRPKASGSNHASNGARSALARMLLMVKKLASISRAVIKKAPIRP
jgi:hypothetical protein